MVCALNRPSILVFPTEEVRMTMQVAMVGKGGIVIASDTKVTRESRLTVPQIGYEADLETDELKIEFSEQRNIAVSCADDLKDARTFARRIISDLRDEDLTNEYTAATAMERIAKEVFAQERKVRCLIALKCPEWQLFTCTNPSGTDDETCKPSFRVWEIAGHLTNPAFFLARKFYDENSAEAEYRSVDELTHLAAYMVLSAGQLNPRGIGGLDVVCCDGSGVHRLPGKSLSELKGQAKEWDRSIEKLIFTPSSITPQPD